MSDVETQTTLRENIEAAFDEVPQEQLADTRPRDETGKFVAKTEQPTEQAQQSTEAPEKTTETVTAAPVVKARPSSWKKEYEEHWSKLDPTVQDYISQRESDYAKGVSTYKQNWDNAAPIYEAMQPFMPVLQQHNIAPQQWIQGLGNAHMALVQGTPEQKLQMFAKLATDYGVPLQALMGQQQDPQFSMMAQELGRLKNEWTQYRTAQQQHEQAMMQSEIEKFATDKPHFEAVRDTMAGLLQSGVASDLQTAYDKAIRLNDEIWKQQQEQAKQADAAKAAEAQREVVAKAKAKAVSPRSSSPTGMMSSGNGKKGLRETLAEQIDAVSSGRV